MAKRRLIFTPVGAAVLVIALVMLFRSLYVRNAYEMIISLTLLFLLLLLGLIGARKAAKLKTLEAGWKPPLPMTANAGDGASYSEPWLITGLDTAVPSFFRLHFIARGKFFPGGGNSGSCPVFAETSAPRGGDTASLQLNFPMSGVFQGEGYCRLRDIFGFYSFSCGQSQQRTVKVRSAPFIGKKPLINTQSGAEDKKTKTSSDEERYYMREYTPGDRFRDINWKSSEKIDSLITRISPDNQEKVNRVDVYFRNYGAAGNASLEALWLLDRAKARLAQFLRSLLEEQANYVFNVRAAQGSWEIADSEDLEDFLDELAAVSFTPLQNEKEIPAGTAELYIFSTACDIGLNGFVLSCSPRPVTLFIVQPLAIKEKKTKAETERETLFKRNFPVNGCFPSPRWYLNSKIKLLGVQSGAARLQEVAYAETKI
jgi:hypothetical protein